MVEVVLVILEVIMVVIDRGVSGVESNGEGNCGDSGRRGDGENGYIDGCNDSNNGNGMEMLVAVVMVMVMKIKAIDNGNGDDNYDSQESNKSTH